MIIETIGTYAVPRGYVTVSVEPLRKGGFGVFKDGFLAPGVRAGQYLERELPSREAAKRLAEIEVLVRGGSLGQTGEAMVCGEVQWAARERLRLDTRSKKPKRFWCVPAQPDAG